MTFPLNPLLKKAGSILIWVLIFLSSLWAFGALWFDFPVTEIRHAAALCYLIGIWVPLLFFSRIRRAARLTALGVAALIAIWWWTLQPGNDRNWEPDVAREPWAEVQGDLVTLHNVRNSDYFAEIEGSNSRPRWETRTLRLSQLTGLDVALNYWGSSWMAHPILSFQFGDAVPLAISIETRKEKGESYSAIGGLYRQYELVYVVTDERDLLRVRTNYRKGEEVYLYHTTLPVADVRERFLEYVQAINELRKHPRWYHAITTNCTTAIRSQHALQARIPWDWRMLINGKIDEFFYQAGLLVTDGLPFQELKRRALINPAAQEADQAPDFSQRIRAGRPGFAP